MCDWADRSCGVGKQGKTRVRAREEPMVRWCRGMAHHCQETHVHGTATSEVHMEIIMKLSEALPCVKKPRFTHIRDNLRGDVSGKRFNTHAMERNVARIGEVRCGDNKGMESASGE